MEAFVYLQVRTGTIGPSRNRLSSTATARRSVVVIGEWDVSVLDRRTRPRDGRRPACCRSCRRSRASSARSPRPSCPPIGSASSGFGGLPTPQIIRGACYVHIEADAGAAAGLYERLSEIGGVSGAAVLGGRWDLMACIPRALGGRVRGRARQDPRAPGGPFDEHAGLRRLRGARGGPGPVQLVVLARAPPAGQREPNALLRDQRLLHPVEAPVRQPRRASGPPAARAPMRRT